MTTPTMFMDIAIYFAIGQFWWWRIIIASPMPAEDADERQELIDGDARGDLALLVVKATFISLWPLALAFGWLSARLF